MKKVVRLTESDLVRLVKRIVKENESEKYIYPFGEDGFRYLKDLNGWSTDYPDYIKLFFYEGKFDDIDEANEMLQDVFNDPEFKFVVTHTTSKFSTVALMKGDKKITAHYPVDFGGSYEAYNRDRFSRSNDAFYDPDKRY